MKGFKDFLTESKMTFDQAREILDLTGGFTPEDVKLAYKKMSAKHHPDKRGDVEMMKKVNLAYDLLKSKSGGAIKNTVDWDEIDRIYKELDAKVRLDLASKFKPDVFVKYFSEFYKQAFSYEIKWSEGRSSSPSFTWFQAKFHNQDKSIAFDLTVSVYLTNLRQKNTSLSVNPDISYPMNIETVGYANMKKQKMGKKDWDYKTNHSILYTPNKLFPEAKMTKIAAEVGSATNSVKPMKRADFYNAMKNEIGATVWNTSDDTWTVPAKDGEVLVARQVFMRVGHWSVVSVGTREKYKFLTHGRIYKSVPEDTSSVALFKSFKNMTMAEVISHFEK